MGKRVGTLSLVCVLVTFAHVAAAQEAISYASIAGRVADPSGAVVTGARVTIRQTETSVSVTADTDRDGRFRFPYLRTGTYEVTVAQPGFATDMERVIASAGSAFDLSITLSLGNVADAVSVIADATVIEAARSQIAST